MRSISDISLVAVYATDWNTHLDQVELDGDFGLADAVVVGYLVEDEEDRLTVAPQLFLDDDTVRFAVTIPRSCVTAINVLKPSENVQVDSSSPPVHGLDSVAGYVNIQDLKAGDHVSAMVDGKKVVGTVKWEAWIGLDCDTTEIRLTCENSKRIRRIE